MPSRFIASSVIKPALWLTIALGFKSQAGATQPAKSVDATQQVDINRGTMAELMHVPGMTSSWAARIIRFRPYRTKLDLVQLGVITPDVYQQIRDRVIAHRMTPEAKAFGTVAVANTKQLR